MQDSSPPLLCCLIHTAICSFFLIESLWILTTLEYRTSSQSSSAVLDIAIIFVRSTANASWKFTAWMYLCLSNGNFSKKSVWSLLLKINSVALGQSKRSLTELYRMSFELSLLNKWHYEVKGFLYFEKISHVGVHLLKSHHIHKLILNPRNVSSKLFLHNSHAFQAYLLLQ